MGIKKKYFGFSEILILLFLKFASEIKENKIVEVFFFFFKFKLHPRMSTGSPFGDNTFLKIWLFNSSVCKVFKILQNLLKIGIKNLENKFDNNINKKKMFYEALIANNSTKKSKWENDKKIVRYI